MKTRGFLWRKSSIAHLVLPEPPPPLWYDSRYLDQQIVVAWSGSGSEVLICPPHAPWARRSARLCHATGQGRREWHGTSNAQAKQKGSRQLHFLGATYASTLEFMERRFLDRDTVCCNPDGLVLCEPRKNRDEIDMEVTEHACPKVSVLGAGSLHT